MSFFYGAFNELFGDVTDFCEAVSGKSGQSGFFSECCPRGGAREFFANHLKCGAGINIRHGSLGILGHRNGRL